MNSTCLILVRGLGGSGKTTLSTNLSRNLKIPVINRDDVKPFLRSISPDENTVVDTAYQIMNNLARIQLHNGVSVILDANARFQVMEKQYLDLCSQLNTRLIVINCVCSNYAVWEERINRRGETHELSFQETRDMTFECFFSKDQIEVDTCLINEKQALSHCINWFKNLKIIS